MGSGRILLLTLALSLLPGQIRSQSINAAGSAAKAPRTNSIFAAQRPASEPTADPQAVQETHQDPAQGPKPDTLEATPGSITASAPRRPGELYAPPTGQERLHNFTFDAFGPYPIFTAAASAGIHQATDSPPEWREGSAAYGRRFGSSYGIGFVETSTRYGLAAALREDTLYYQCACKGIFPRLGHAVLSSFTGRRGADGHRVISLPSIVAPYAGTFTGTYAWYPRRFGAEDAFRMGNNGYLSYIGGNIALEFLYGGPHSLLSKAHLPIPAPAAAQQPKQ